MKPIPLGRLRIIGGIVLVTLAVPAMANTFMVMPDTSGGFGNYVWSINIDGAGATGNPELVVTTGQTYSFVISSTNIHPFWIDLLPGLGGTSPYPSGAGTALSANGVTDARTITLNLPADAPDTLRYACGNHPEMTNTITVIHDLVFRANFD